MTTSAGRPRKEADVGADGARYRTLSVRLTEDAYDALVGRAAGFGVSMTAYLEAWGQIYLLRQKDGMPTPVYPQLDEAILIARRIEAERRRRDRRRGPKDRRQENP